MQEAALRKAALEAAFDGEAEELVKLLDKGASVIKGMVGEGEGSSKRGLLEVRGAAMADAQR